MALTTGQLQVIRDEYDNDPAGVGYEALGAVGAITNAMNLIRPEALPEHPKVRRGVVDTYEVVSRLNYTEVEALTAGQRVALTILTMAPQIDISSDNVRSAMISWFTANGAGTTRQMLGDYQDRDASRAEVIFNQTGFSVSQTDVAEALALP